MPGYPILTDSEDTYPLRDVSVRAMREASAVEVRAAHKDPESRARLADQMGVELGEPLARPAYAVAMARALFPTAKDAIGDGEALSVPEVNRAVRDFFAALA